jgi:hypothetical protein
MGWLVFPDGPYFQAVARVILTLFLETRTALARRRSY